MKRPLSIRWRITFTYLSLIVLALAALGFSVDHVLEARYVTTVTRQLERQTALAKKIVENSVNRSAAPQRIAEEIGETARCRVTLIGGDGEVQGDNQHDIRTMDNHLSRAEVRQALSSGTGSSIRFSKTLGVDMLYVAMPVSPHGSSVRILRLALPMWDVEAATRHLRSVILLAGLVTALVGGLLTMLLANTITRPIADVTRAANQIASGDLRQSVPATSRDEIGQLASAFNTMSVHLSERIDQLREEKAKAETMLSRLADGIIVTDRKGDVLLFNKAAQRIFGLDETAALNRSLAESTLHYDLSRRVSECLKNRTVMTGEILLHQPSERVLDCYVAPFEAEDSGHYGAVVVLHDLTEIRRLERVRKDFVANVSHELRTPVASIRAMTETLLMGAKDEEEMAERFLRTINEESVRLTNLLDDLLALSAIESGKKELRPETIDLRPRVAKILEKLKHQIETKRLRTEISVGEELKLNADPDSLEQILLNLIDNAIKYTPEGGEVTIRACPGTGEGGSGGVGDVVAPTSPFSHSSAYVVLEVRDTGMGIPSTDLPRIFERFYRVDKARSREMGGTGLGLSIVKHLVEAHGGTVYVTSEVGKGSTFAVLFPPAPAGAPSLDTS